MTAIITSQGYTFNVEGDGFVRYHAAADFYVGVDALQAALNAMPQSEVAALHAAGKAWIENECADDRPAGFDALEDAAHAAATAGWKDPSAVLISVSSA